jgi:uncharacterized membrane protein YqjE
MLYLSTMAGGAVILWPANRSAAMVGWAVCYVLLVLAAATQLFRTRDL